MRQLILPLLLVIITICAGCFWRRPFVCGLLVATNAMPTLESRLLTLKTTGISDTSPALISGITFEQRVTEGRIETDTLPFTGIGFINPATTDTTFLLTDWKGHFQQYLPPGRYEIRVQDLGKNTLVVQQVDLRPGELKQLEALLGQGHPTTITTTNEQAPFVQDEYEVVLHVNGRVIPASQTTISRKDLYRLDRISLLKGEEVVTQIRKWDINVLENDAVYAHRTFNTSKVKAGFVREVRRLKAPRLVFVRVYAFKTREEWPKSRNRVLQVID